MIRAQAKRCTRRELSYLAHWRRLGYRIGINDAIPLSTVTPPAFATRKPFRDAMLGCAIILGALGLLCLWLGKAAGIL